MRRNQFDSDAGSRSWACCTVACLAAATLLWLALSAAVDGRAYAAIPCSGTAMTFAGADSQADVVGVDDDLELQLNGTQFFLDNDELAQDLQPIHFNGQHGDQLRVIASNSTVFGGNEYIGDFALYCDANGAQQVLNATPFSNASGPAGEVFYDQTFTIDFAPPSSPTGAAAPTGQTGQRAAAKRRCKKKFPKGPRRTKCLKKAKKLPV